jgi:hypothetical protein
MPWYLTCIAMGDFFVHTYLIQWTGMGGTKKHTVLDILYLIILP